MTAERRGHAAMLLFSVLVAGSFALGAQVATLIEPAALNAVRFAIAACIIGALGWATGTIKASDAHAPWRYVFLGALFCTYFVLMFEGLKTAPPVSAAAVFTLVPVLTAFFGYLLLKQVTSARMAFALAIGATGALWVIFQADLEAVIAFEIGRGEVVYFAGCVAHAIYTPLVARLNRGVHPIAFAFGILVAGTLILATVGASSILATDWAALPAIVWITILYTAVFASAATFVLLNYATLQLPAAKVMAYTYLTPSWVILWQFCLTGAVPPVFLLGGVLLTCVALTLLLRVEYP